MSETLNIAFIKARWHADIVDQALTGFEQRIGEAGAPATVTPFDVPGADEGARAYLTRHLGETRLVDLLLLPILLYGSPTPHDIDFPSFVVLWKSIFEEGFARPAGGIRPLLNALRARPGKRGGGHVVTHGSGIDYLFVILID